MSPSSRAPLVWLLVVAGLALGLAWVALRPDTQPSHQPREERAHAQSLGAAGAEDHPPPDEPSGELGDPEDREPGAPPTPPPAAQLAQTPKAIAKEGDALLKRKEYAEARELAMGCLAANPGDKDCHRLRVYSYTRQHPIGETREILRWCISVMKDDLNCMRALRQFHLERGERMEASSIANEIRDQWPYDSVELPTTEAPSQPPSPNPTPEPLSPTEPSQDPNEPPDPSEPPSDDPPEPTPSPD
ncbi:MAG: hypothetical protein KIT72_07165 [Polyangiaceae bacterium]|nr:hypothetical protein [Polyangiaceae bacterium]MCW5790183.1 hypothetical protein [Polyangiaceae bacterium]